MSILIYISFVNFSIRYCKVNKLNRRIDKVYERFWEIPNDKGIKIDDLIN